MNRNELHYDILLGKSLRHRLIMSLPHKKETIDTMQAIDEKSTTLEIKAVGGASCATLHDIFPQESLDDNTTTLRPKCITKEVAFECTDCRLNNDLKVFRNAKTVLMTEQDAGVVVRHVMRH